MEFSDLNWFDIAVISIILISAIFAFVKGFIRTVFSLITWGGAVGISIYFYPEAKIILDDYIANEKVSMAFASLGLFIVSFVILAVIDGLLVDLLDNFRAGVLDRSLGFVFGCIRGFIIVIALFFVIHMLVATMYLNKDDEKSPWWVKEFNQASMHELLLDAMTFSFRFLPESYRAYLDDTIKNAKSMADVMTGKAIGDDVVLNIESREIMKKVILALPPEDIAHITKVYNEHSETLTDEEKIKQFREIYYKYKYAVQVGKVDPNMEISEKEQQILEVLFSHDYPQEPAAYDEKNIKDIERLIDTVDQ